MAERQTPVLNALLKRVLHHGPHPVHLFGEHVGPQNSHLGRLSKIAHAERFAFLSIVGVFVIAEAQFEDESFGSFFLLLAELFNKLSILLCLGINLAVNEIAHLDQMKIYLAFRPLIVERILKHFAE